MLKKDGYIFSKKKYKEYFINSFPSHYLKFIFEVDSCNLINDEKGIKTLLILRTERKN